MLAVTPLLPNKSYQILPPAHCLLVVVADWTAALLLWASIDLQQKLSHWMTPAQYELVAIPNLIAVQCLREAAADLTVF
jgi:hypothetical protein